MKWKLIWNHVCIDPCEAKIQSLNRRESKGLVQKIQLFKLGKEEYEEDEEVVIEEEEDDDDEEDKTIQPNE